MVRWGSGDRVFATAVGEDFIACWRNQDGMFKLGREEPWKEKRESVKYVPLQARVGDMAVYLNKSGYEIEFLNEKYIILPHSAILLLIRDETLFD